MAALQGPEAVRILGPLVPDVDLSALTYYTATEQHRRERMGSSAARDTPARTGSKSSSPPPRVENCGMTLMQAGEEAGIAACGLGCRDTLRLEAAMPLYGHEMDEAMDPFTAGLAFGVKMQAADFIGKPALAMILQQPKTKKRVGLRLEGRRIAREGAVILHDESEVGRVTSGTFSPTLEQSIAMGYVAVEHSTVDTPLQIDIRGQRVPTSVAALPFYSRPPA